MTKQEYRQQIDKVIADGKYKADWASLSGHKTPTWYYGGKFGIFIHWGVYSVPGYGNEWYPRNMYNQASPEFEYHRKTYGDQKDFGYKDFIPMFQAERFDPDEWAALFKEAGRDSSRRCASTTTASPCSIPPSTAGTPRPWAPAGTWRGS